MRPFAYRFLVERFSSQSFRQIRYGKKKCSKVRADGGVGGLSEGGGTRASGEREREKQRKQIMRSKIDECNLWQSAAEQNITKESRMIYVCVKFLCMQE